MAAKDEIIAERTYADRAGNLLLTVKTGWHPTKAGGYGFVCILGGPTSFRGRGFELMFFDKSKGQELHDDTVAWLNDFAHVALPLGYGGWDVTQLPPRTADS